jgi:hypothetical protein
MADLMTASCTQNTDRECREEDCCMTPMTGTQVIERITKYHKEFIEGNFCEKHETIQRKEDCCKMTQRTDFTIGEFIALLKYFPAESNLHFLIDENEVRFAVSEFEESLIGEGKAVLLRFKK